MGLFDNFSSIDYSGLQTIFDSAIGSMIDSDACTVPCTLEFGVTRYDDCNNCVYDPIGKKSSNVYEAGGPVPFPFGGICPVCNGLGKKPVISTEDIKVIIVYNPKEFVNYDTSVNVQEGTIQTMAKLSLMSKFQRAKTLKASTDINDVFTRRYERIYEPTPCGFGNSTFCVCTWKRV